MIIYLSGPCHLAPYEDAWPHQFRRCHRDAPIDTRLSCIVGNQQHTDGFGPHPSGRIGDTPPADEIWTVEGGDSRDIAIAAEAGIAVRAAPPLPPRKPAPYDCTVSARQIVCDFFSGMETIMGVAGIDYSRTKGDGNIHGVMNRIAIGSERIAIAASIVKAASLHDRDLCILRLVIVEGRSLADTGRIVGLSDVHTGRLFRQAVSKIRQCAKNA